jgi:hypothetical protein
MRIRDWQTHSVQDLIVLQNCVTGSSQSHAAVFSYVEPPGVHGSFDCDAQVRIQLLDQLFSEFSFVSHFTDIPGHRPVATPL